MKITTLLIASLLAATLHAQDKPADPFTNKGPSSGSTSENSKERILSEKENPINLSVCYEAFSLPLAMAAELQRQGISDPALYAKLISEVGKESVRQELIQIVRTPSGTKAAASSFTEQIYATEYDPITRTKDVAVGGAVYPFSWETRNAGTMLEVEAGLDMESGIVDLKLRPEMVSLAGYSHWKPVNESEVKMPDFETQTIETSAFVPLGKPFLIGSISRPPVSKLDSDSANRVWLAFVSVTLAKQ